LPLYNGVKRRRKKKPVRMQGKRQARRGRIKEEGTKVTSSALQIGETKPRAKLLLQLERMTIEPSCERLEREGSGEVSMNQPWNGREESN